MDRHFFKTIKILVWIPVLVTGILITGFSSQNGNESSGLSRKAANIIVCGLERADIISFTDYGQREQLIETLQFPVRKCAHMTEYAVFTTFTYIALLADSINSKKRKYITFLIGFLLAASDELHQRFVPGRCGSIKDVIIDSAGCIIGLLLIEGIWYIAVVKRTKKL